MKPCLRRQRVTGGSTPFFSAEGCILASTLNLKGVSIIRFRGQLTDVETAVRDPHAAPVVDPLTQHHGFDHVEDGMGVEL